MYLSPSGRPSEYRYMYKNLNANVCRGDIVTRDGNQYAILNGLGGQKKDPTVRLQQLTGPMKSRTSSISDVKPLCRNGSSECNCRFHQKWRAFVLHLTEEKERCRDAFRKEMKMTPRRVA